MRNFRYIFITMILGLAIAGFGAAYVWNEIAADVSTLAAKLEYLNPTAASTLLTTDGQPLGHIQQLNRIPVSLDQLPGYVVQAFISAEDRDFYKHAGFSPKGVFRAAISNLRAGGIVQGGSTITQQLVRSLVLTPQQTWRRKILEVVLAYRLEQQLKKSEILEEYLNFIYLGAGAYGVEAAARTYFGRGVAAINPAEAAVLAGLPQAPSRYAPHRNPQLALRRQQYVLQRMYEDGYLTADDYKKWSDFKVRFASPPRNGGASKAPWLQRWFVDEQRQLQPFSHLSRDGLTIHATLNSSAMRHLAQLCHTTRDPGRSLRTMAVVIDMSDGGVRAVYNDGPLNMTADYDFVRQLRRPLGRLLPPLLSGLVIQEQLDWQQAFALGPQQHVSLLDIWLDPEASAWTPLIMTIGPQKFRTYLQTFGLAVPGDEVAEWSLGLGAVTTWEVAQAYDQLLSGRHGQPLHIMQTATRPVNGSEVSGRAQLGEMLARQKLVQSGDVQLLRDHASDHEWLVMLKGQVLTVVLRTEERGRSLLASESLDPVMKRFAALPVSAWGVTARTPYGSALNFQVVKHPQSGRPVSVPRLKF